MKVQLELWIYPLIGLNLIPFGDPTLSLFIRNFVFVSVTTVKFRDFYFSLVRLF